MSTNPPDEYARFQNALKRVLHVSKEELQRREQQYQNERAGKPKRGPKPRSSSASDHASSNGD
jgi:hypothetical protein